MIPNTYRRRLCRVMLVIFLAFPFPASAQSVAGGITGRLTDPAGAVIANMAVSCVGPNRKNVRAWTDSAGRFDLPALVPGKYTVAISAPGFEPFTQDVQVTADHTEKIDIQLKIASIEAKVDVNNDRNKGSTDPASNSGAIVLKEKDLEMFSEDPDELKLQLQALAGASAAGAQGQIYIDGFSGTRLPPKSAIREIRINQDPFSAEYDQPGFSRIEIFTKPGSAQFHSLFSWRFNHSALNAGSPFASHNPPYHTTLFSGSLGGPLSRRSSFQFDLDRNVINDNTVINALVLDSSLQPAQINQAIANPKLQTTASFRFDYEVNPKNTFFARYQYYGDSEINDGVGQLALASQAFNLTHAEHTFQFSNTTIVNKRILNESRFEYRQVRVGQVAQNSEPQLAVLGAFIGGGNSIAINLTSQDNYQLQDYLSIDRRKHFLKLGAQLRFAKETDHDTGNFNGTFTFPSLTSFQTTQMGLHDGLTPAQIRAAGGGAAQFSITAGNPSVSNTMIDGATFLLDNFKLRPNVTLSYGLRYEIQNSISDALDFAPRIGLAWGIRPKKSGASRTVLRLGAGIFYTRFGQNLVLNSEQLNGQNQRQFIVQNPDFFPAVPDINSLANSLFKPSIYQIDLSLRAPFVTQTSISIERKLPLSNSLAITYLNSHGSRQLLSRNINAPLPGTSENADPTSGIRPYPHSGNIYEYESRGRFEQNQVTVGLRIDGLHKARLNANYVLNFVNSNTAGANSFPSNSYNIDQDYGRAAYDVRHQFNFGGQIDLPLGAYINPFLIFTSGQPYNITVGHDLNGDSIFNDRPALANDLSRPSIAATKFGLLDTLPMPGQAVIPRNIATGPPKFVLNIRLVKAFSLGNKEIKPANNRGSAQSQSASVYKNAWQPMYAIRFEFIVNNILNRTNFATPIGNLNSQFFGKSIALAGSPFSTAASTRQIILRTVFRF